MAHGHEANEQFYRASTDIANGKHANVYAGRLSAGVAFGCSPPIITATEDITAGDMCVVEEIEGRYQRYTVRRVST